MPFARTMPCIPCRNGPDWCGEPVEGYFISDYRQIIDDPRIDVVHTRTPDRWHAKVAAEAMLSGRDVDCEKPMTLTIAEGQLSTEVGLTVAAYL